jgi:hypothetical protein
LLVLTKNFSLRECARAIKSLRAAQPISKYFLQELEFGTLLTYRYSSSQFCTG